MLTSQQARKQREGKGEREGERQKDRDRKRPKTRYILQRHNPRAFFLPLGLTI
jgi:hypothetical protein